MAISQGQILLEKFALNKSGSRTAMDGPCMKGNMVAHDTGLITSCDEAIIVSHIFRGGPLQFSASTIIPLSLGCGC